MATDILASAGRSVIAVNGAHLMQLTMLPLWMGLFCLSSLTASAWADEVPAEEETIETISAEESPIVSRGPVQGGMARFFNTPDDVQHAGLLGKYYVQSLAVEQESDEQYLRSFDNKWTGSDTLVNLPLITPHTSSLFAADLFAGYSTRSFNKFQSEHVDTMPWGEQLHHSDRELNARTQEFVVGATIYSDRGGRFRPFIQAGVSLTHSHMASTGGEIDVSPSGFHYTNASNNFYHTYNNHDVRALLNPGFEYDINSILAYRMTLMTETQGRFNDSLLTSELILWPVNRFFLKLGGGCDLDGEQSISYIGGGFAF